MATGTSKWYPITSGQLMQHDGDMAWTRPENGWYKVNVDAALFSSQKRTGSGCIVKNSQGHVLMARAISPREVEAISVGEALSWLKKKGVDKCIVESNSLQMIEGIRQTSY